MEVELQLLSSTYLPLPCPFVFFGAFFCVGTYVRLLAVFSGAGGMTVLEEGAILGREHGHEQSDATAAFTELAHEGFLREALVKNVRPWLEERF